MGYFRDRSLSAKLTVLITAVSTAGVIAGFAAVTLIDARNFRRELRSDTALAARLGAEYCVAPLAFGYREEAGQLLAKLAVFQDVAYAAVYDESGAAAIIDIDHLNVGCLGADIGNALASFVSRLKKMDKDEPAEKITTLFFSAYHKSNPLSLLDYKLALPSIQRTSVTRILRIMRRHHFENNRLPEMMKKIPDRFLARLKDSPKEFSFLTKEWLRKIF